jgi:hypothetical protein
MNEEIKVTETKKVENIKEEGFTSRRVIYYVLGLLEVLMGFRFIFKVLGANPESGFVSFIYAVTKVFLAPFTAIFSTSSTAGAETKAVLEPATIIGMLVYALLAWGIVKFIIIIRERKSPRS